jgi:purine nucleoside permease
MSTRERLASLPALLRAGMLGAFCFLPVIGTAAADEVQIPIKVVVVTMFEVEHDSGDEPGEFQEWVEQFPLEEILPFPQGPRKLRYNPEKGVLGVVAGIGTARTASSIMGLGMDPRFDLTKAYWLVVGIAGVNPDAASPGSALWAEWVVDGDLAHEIDPREAPEGWTTGYLPLDKVKPFEEPREADSDGMAYRLDAGLVDWAYGQTRDIKLPDTEALQKLRAPYAGFPNAQKPPAVMKGDSLSAMTFWHGRLLNQWAEEWVKYWTDGKGVFATTAMEDTGTLGSLALLAKAGKIDGKRVLVLRTASNFSMQHEGQTAAASLAGEKGGYSAYHPALDAAYAVGSAVVNELVDHWDRYAGTMPGGG